MADDIFNEVDEDLRAERMRVRARRVATVGIVLVAAAAIGVGAWQFALHQQHQRALAAGETYFTAQKDADVAPSAAAGPDAPLTPDQQRAIGLYGKVAAGDGPDGVRTLSRLRMAALDWSAKQPDKALALWDQVSHDGAADPALRQLADLLWVQHQPATADASLLKTRLRDALSPSSPWHQLATEADALIDLHAGNTEEARRKLTALAQDPGVSDSLRARASGVLDTLPPAPPRPAPASTPRPTTQPAKTGG